MDNVLCFKHHLRVELFDGERVFLIGEQDRFMLHGRIYGLIAPLLDGRRTVRQVIAALEGRASPLEVYHGLMLLQQKGYVAEVTAGQPPEAAGFWQSLGADAAQAQQRLEATPVAVRAFGEEDAAPLVEALAGAGFAVADQAKLCVVLTGDYLSPDLEAWNREALARGLSWMPVKPSGTSPCMGPMFRPGGACWECLAHRLRENRPVEAYLRRHAAVETPLPPQRVGVATSIRAALALAALALSRWIAEGGAGVLDDKLLSLDIARFQVSEHAVMRRPQCPVCGDPGLLRARVQRPVVLESLPKRFIDDGGHRVLSPDETYARYERLISPITGVVGSLGPAARHGHPLWPVYRATFRVCPAGDAPSFNDFHSMCAGKGRTHAQARASALCEALERHAAIFRTDMPRVRARLSDLGEEGIHPNDLQNFSEAQYQSRQEWNAAVRDPRHAVPIPFDDRAIIDWTPMWSLTRERRRYVPTAYCYAHMPLPPEERFCSFSYNGHAAGNAVEEAILQGFLELVERDAVSVWWHNRLRRPRVDLGSFGDPELCIIEDRYRSLGWPLWVLDVTHDLGIPAFVALARSSDDGRLCIGFGCHLDALIGVSRAISELTQLFVSTPGASARWDTSAMDDLTHLFPEDGLPPRTRDDYPSVRRDDLRDDIRDCVARAERAGLETLVLDQTQPDVGLCVVKVVVPGLRHFWRRLGPGRLYDVPVRMGWLSRPHEEGELNPAQLLV